MSTNLNFLTWIPKNPLFYLFLFKKTYKYGLIEANVFRHDQYKNRLCVFFQHEPFLIAKRLKTIKVFLLIVFKRYKHNFLYAVKFELVLPSQPSCLHISSIRFLNIFYFSRFISELFHRYVSLPNKCISIILIITHITFIMFINHIGRYICR